MLSRAGLYALQASLHLARIGENERVSAAAMAERLQVPPEYLAKVLRRMAQEGLLESVRGAHGGYRLARDPETLTVEDVVAPFEVVDPPSVCLLGGPCDASDPCTAHLRRLEWREASRRVLAATLLSDLLGPIGASLPSIVNFDI